jgi:hypothetical protein
MEKLNGQALVTTRFYIVGSRLIEFVVAAPSKKPRKEDTRRFFDSLELR